MTETVQIPNLVQVVAKTKDGTIGLNGRMPWQLPSDLKLFQSITMGKPCLMGRKTWESLPFPLKGRPNLILTSDTAYHAKGAEVLHSLKDLIGRGYELAGETDEDEVCIIGGAQLYEATLPYCSTIYMTEIDASVEGDTYYPSLAPEWERVERTPIKRGMKDDYSFALSIFKRPIGRMMSTFPLPAE